MNKRIFITFAFAFIGSLSFAQSPSKMSFQAVIRNNSNNLVVNSPVGMRISILQGSSSGPATYVETHVPSTNANGLATFEIGGGTIISGTFNGIDWSNGPYFVKTETDPTGGTSYTITGTTQILSVPYSLYSLKAESAENVPANVGAFFNDAGYLTTEVDGSTSNELQTISRTGTTVSLSNGGGSYQDSVNVYTAGNGINITGTTISSNAITVGDIKHGFQMADHNGWYLLDGRALTTLPVVAQSNASLLGITVNLPNATNRFIGSVGGVGTTGGATSFTLTQANLPNLTLNGNAASNGAHTHTVDPAAVNSTSNGSHQHDFITTVNDAGNSSSQGFPGGGHTGMRTTDRQDMTVGNNIIQAAGNHVHSVDVPSTTSSSSGAHTHTVTVSTGGSGTAVNFTPQYLSANTFIYLGQ